MIDPNEAAIALLALENLNEEHYDWDEEIIDCGRCGTYHPLSTVCEAEDVERS